MEYEARERVEEKVRPSAWYWHLYLFFRPRTFFRHYASNQVPLLTAACAWLFGIAGSIDRTETSFLRGSTAPWLESWTAYWVVMLLGGMLGGLFFHAIGGWWYRLRLRWSGATSPDPALARRVYLFSSQILALPVILTAISESTLHDTPLASLRSEGTWWHVAFLLFPFWSVACSYVGVRTMFEVRRGAAMAWFAVLPMLLYSIAIAGSVLVFALQDEPDLDDPGSYRGTLLEFSYPGNWRWELEETDEGMESVALEGMQNAFLRVMTYSSAEGPEAELELSLEPFRSFDEWEDGAAFDSWGSYRGVGSTGTFVREGARYDLCVFVATTESPRLVESQLICARDHEDVVRPVWDLLGETLHVEQPR